MQDTARVSRLVRGIRKWDLVALVLNAIIGAGIFGLPSRAYALAGAYSILAYTICAIPVFLIILCFAEVGSRFMHTGGPYLYARSTFGRVVGFEIGWLSWLARLTGFAALCNLFVDYLSYFLSTAGSGAGRAAAICIVIFFLATANIVGVRVAARVTNLFTIGKLLPLGLLVIAGILVTSSQGDLPPVVPSYTSFSAAVLILVFAFTGFEMAVIPAGESSDPRRHIPFALIVGTAIAAVLYIAIQAVCIASVPNLASSERPLADAGGRLLGAVGASIVSLGALISIMGTMNANMLAAPRLLFAMSEQGQLPAFLSGTHRRFRTPHVAILFSMTVMLILTLSGTFISAATLSTIIRLATYAVTCAALPVLRRSGRGGDALFAVPGGDFVAVAALILIAWLWSSSSWPEMRPAVVAAVAGLLVYGASGMARRSAYRSPVELERL